MRVGIHQAGHQERVGPVQPSARLDLPIAIAACSDAHDALAANRESAVVYDAMLSIHGDDVASCVDPVGWLAPCCRNENAQQRERQFNPGMTHQTASGRDLLNGSSRFCAAD